MCRWLTLFTLFIGLAACVEEELPPGQARGYMPIYLQDINQDTISVLPPQPIVHGGRIVIYKELMFQVEQNKGVHIFDIKDTSNIAKIGFYSVFGCNQLAIQSDHMYINRLTDLLVINISDLYHPRITDYKKGFYKSFPFLPPPARGYFECVDPSKGIVSGWKDTLLINPECIY